MKSLIKLLFFAVLAIAGIIYVAEPRWHSEVAKHNDQESVASNTTSH